MILIFLILNNYSYGFSRALLKFLNTQYYINIYLLGSIIGIVQLCFIILKQLIIYEQLKFNDTKIYCIIIQFMCYLLLHFLYFKLLKVDLIYTLISYNLPFFLYSLIFLKENTIWIILNIISLISSLIYLEILELNFCNLSKNLKRKIRERGEN